MIGPFRRKTRGIYSAYVLAVVRAPACFSSDQPKTTSQLRKRPPQQTLFASLEHRFSVSDSVLTTLHHYHPTILFPPCSKYSPPPLPLQHPPHPSPLHNPKPGNGPLLRPLPVDAQPHEPRPLRRRRLHRPRPHGAHPVLGGPGRLLRVPGPERDHRQCREGGAGGGGPGVRTGGGGVTKGVQGELGALFSLSRASEDHRRGRGGDGREQRWDLSYTRGRVLTVVMGSRSSISS